MKRGNKNLKLLAGGFLLFVLVFGFLPGVSSAEDIKELSEKVLTLGEQREALEAQIEGFNSQIKFLEDQLAKSDQEIKLNEEKIQANQKILTEKQKDLSEYLSEIYQEGQTSLFEKIAKSRNFSDFFDRNEYLNSIKGKLTETVAQINKTKRDLEREQKALGEAKIKSQLMRASLEKQKSDSQVTLLKVTEEEKQIREKFALRFSQYKGATYCRDAGKIIKAKYSVFSFPTDCGYISQGFGMTEFAAIEKAYHGAIHNGVDVGVDTGTTIKSIGKGTVYAKGTSPSGGWGNWLMVKLDKVKIKEVEVEFYALYGHMIIESPLKVGDKVDSGTPIGLVGGTPYWAPHLHFSLLASDSGWSDGKFGPYPGNVVDPLDYMDIPISISGADWDPQYIHL